MCSWWDGQQLITINSHTLGEQVSTFITRAKVQGSEHRNPMGAARRTGAPKHWTTQMVPPAGFNNWSDFVPEGVESAEPEQSQRSQENSLLLNINSSTQLKCYWSVLFRQEKPEEFILWNECKYINWNFVPCFYVGCILQVSFLQKRLLQEDLNAYHAKKYGLIFDQFIPFHTYGSQFLKFKPSNMDAA